uniref:EF-1-gamma C-terminal domain-containing protein n=1 Tax=Parascaris equorum TaxID=6256 RepID=A0A914SDK2_PAREQ
MSPTLIRLISSFHCTEVVQWLQWAEGSLLPNVLGFVLPSVSAAHVDNKVNVLIALVYRIKTDRDREEGDLASCLSCYCERREEAKYVLDSAIRAPLTNVNRWFNTIINQSCVKEILGEVSFATQTAKFDRKTFVMDSFKRVYSNEDTATKAIPYFWENFDAANYSIWYAEYKYPEELTLTFMSCNLIGAFTLCPDWQVDYESYEWKKLDPADEGTKKLVNEYLMWEGEFGGKKFNQGKIFK